MAKEELLEIKDLLVRFYTYEGVVEAIDGVNLKIKKGETLGLVGETGCGKSVTSLSVMRLVPSPGRIEKGNVFMVEEGKKTEFLTQSESFMRKIRGKDIAMIFQEPRAYLNPVYSVRDQISEVLLVHRKTEFLKKALESLEKEKKKKTFEMKVYERMIEKPNAVTTKILSRLLRRKRKLNEELKKEVVRLIKEMGIPDPERVAEMYPHELSGGMAQRVVIAMAIACNPVLLIADEPTTNLDVTVQAQILSLIKELKDRFQSSILYITHDLGVVAEICDRVAVMYAGNIVELAEVFELFESPLHPYAKGLLESIPRPGQEFKSIPGTVPSLINPPSGCRFHDRCPYAMSVCTTVKPRLIEVQKDHFVACHLVGGSK